MILMLIVFVGAINKWLELLKIKTTVSDTYGEQVLEVVPE
jgi:carbon starvation protein